MNEIMTKQEIQEWKRQELLKFYTIYKNSHKRFLEEFTIRIREIEQTRRGKQ